MRLLFSLQPFIHLVGIALDGDLGFQAAILGKESEDGSARRLACRELLLLPDTHEAYHRLVDGIIPGAHQHAAVKAMLA